MQTFDILSELKRKYCIYLLLFHYPVFCRHFYNLINLHIVHTLIKLLVKKTPNLIVRKKGIRVGFQFFRSVIFRNSVYFFLLNPQS